jgi:hypothetical protein
MTYEPGKKLGHWTLIEYFKGSKVPKKNPRWLCRCECGMQREVQTFQLANGLSRSCGCQNANGWKRAGLGRITSENRAAS